MRRLTLLTAILFFLLQTDYTVTIGQVDASKLPDVTVYVNVTDSAGAPVRGLKQSDFSITEDGKTASITGFAGADDARPVDVVFVFDTTGSMSDEINGVIKTCVAFAEELQRSKRDYRLGLVTFGDAIRGVYGTNGDLTDDVDVFKKWVSSLRAEGGDDGPENSLGALKQATQMKFRANSQLIFILITDAPAHHYSDARQPEGGFTNPDLKYDRILALLSQPRPVAVYSVTEDNSEYRQLASDTGGKFYDIKRNPDFTSIINDIGVAIATQYRLTYLTPRTSQDGTRRNLVVKVGTAEGKQTYLEPHLVTIQSDWRVALALICPLLLSLIVPLIAISLMKRRLSKVTPSLAPVPVVPTSTIPCPHCGQPMRLSAKFQYFPLDVGQGLTSRK